MKKYIYSLFILIALPLLSLSAADKPNFEELLRKVDASGRFDDSDFSGVFTIVTEQPGKEQKLSQIRMFRRDVKKQFLILVQKPEADKGTGYLKEDSHLWMYDPTSRKFSHTSMKDALAGSKAQSSDFEENTTIDDYEIESGEPGMLGKIPVWVLSLKAKHSEVAYDRLRLFIRQDQPLVLKQEEMSLNGRVMRTSFFPRYTEVAPSKYFPAQILIVDEINKGEKSQISLTELSTAKLPDRIFTKAFLEDSK